MKSIVVAPHPDDEILGVGGTLLRRKAEGHQTAWLIVTGISEEQGWSVEKVRQREDEIEAVARLMKFDDVFQLKLPATQLDQLPTRTIVEGVSKAFGEFQPNEVFLPHYSDIHSDHRIIFQAVASCTKWFRYPFVNRILCYETLSETEFGLGDSGHFKANYFIDIAAHLERKLEVMQIYASELGAFPFPRSLEALRTLALLRGTHAGYQAAEAFELLRERG